MKPRTIVGALAVILCLGCSVSSDLIVANTDTRALTVQARFGYDRGREGMPPIRFADVSAMGDRDAWHDAPADAITFDSTGRGVVLTLPPRTAVLLDWASNCDRPATCEGIRVLSLELSGRSGLLSADRAQLRDLFAAENRGRWILWYPLNSHGFLKHLRLTQAAVLFMAIGVAAFTLWAAFAVARTPMPRRWAWVVVALLGIGKLAINWTTGETSTHLLSLPLFGGSVGRNGLFGPWIVACSFPLGAILALRRRHRVLRETAIASAAVSNSPPQDE
jgi:hypothetical protein